MPIGSVSASFTSSEVVLGRGDKQSYAVLVANPKTDSGKDRMRIMTETTNGFVLAEEDLKMRGSGEILEPDSQVFQSSK